MLSVSLKYNVYEMYIDVRFLYALGVLFDLLALSNATPYLDSYKDSFHACRVAFSEK